MSIFKRILVFVLVLAMCSQMAVPALAANSLGTTYTATIDKPTIYVSPEKQTITVTIKTNAPVDLDSITAQALTPAGLKLTGIANETLGFTGAHYNLANGKIAWSHDFVNDNYKTTDTLAVLTYEVPANTPAGTYVIDFNILNISNNFGTTWENGTTVSATLTIGACAHENTKTTTVEKTCDTDGSVTVTCDDCGETISTTVIPAGHTESTKEETTPATCTEEGKRETVTFCTECGSELGRVTTETIPAGHNWGDPIYTWSADYSSCTADHSCTACEEGKEEETVTSTSAITEDATCGKMGSTTYTADFAADWAETQTKTLQNIHATGAHADKDGDGDHNCDACGKTDVSDHTGGTATCQKPATCTECGQPYGDKNPDNHTSKIEYKDITNSQHTAFYPCCSTTVTENHDIDNDARKCVCGVVAKYPVTFNAGGGTFANGKQEITIDVYYGKTPTAPEIPTMQGYDFTGWYPVLAPVGVEGATYTAQWEEKTTVITFNANGGTGTMADQTLGQAIGAELTKNAFQRIGYDFTGWSEDGADGTVQFTDGQEVAFSVDTKTLWAVWEPIEYTITLNLDGGAMPDGVTAPEKYTIESADITLPTPAKTGHSFLGWTGTGLDEATKEVTLPAGSIGNQEYTANWQINQYTVTWAEADEVETLDYGTALEFKGTLPTKTGYVVDGWMFYTMPGYVDYDGTTVPASDVYAYPNWIKNTAKFTITFYDGETVVDSIEVQYDDFFTAPAVPEKEGYTFVDWVDANGDSMPGKLIVEADQNYYVKREANTYDAIFDANGGAWGEDTKKTVPTAFDAEIVAPADPTKTGYEFKGWTPEVGTMNDVNGKTFTARWEIKTYTVTWKIGGEEVAITKATYDEAIDKPTVTIPDNYFGYEWTTEIPETMPADENLVIEGVWRVKLELVDENNNVKNTYYGTAGDSIYANYYGEYYLEGHTFWLVDQKTGAKYQLTYSAGAMPIWPNVTVTENTVLKATFEPEVYTITWKNIDGETLAWTSADWGTTPAFSVDSTPAYPVEMMEAGYTYTFIGWASEQGGEKLETLPTVTAETEFFAVYEKTANYYYVDWYVDGKWYAQTIVAFGQPIAAPEMTLTKEGHSFDGWTVPETMPAKKITLDAGWTVNTHDITWNVDGTTTVTEDVEFGTVITLPENPTKEGYTFIGWEGYTDDMTMPDKDVTFTAQWEIKTYTVTWTVDGETFATTEVTFGEEIIKPENDPVKVGYEFNGWADVPATMPDNENLIIEGTWTANKYNITWMANGGCFFGLPGFEKTSSILTYGTTLFKYNTDPTREGYTFIGWNTMPDGSGDSWTEAMTVPACNLTYYAQWQINTYTVTWTVNGEAYDETQVKFGETITAPAYIVPEGHTFSGWDVPATMPAGNITLNATLTVNVYPIVLLDLNGVEIETREGNYGDFAWMYLPDGVAPIEVTDESRIGIWTGNGLWMVVNGDGTETELTGTTPIPVGGMTVRAQYVFTGWVNDNGWHYEIDNKIQKTGWTEISHADYLENGTGSDWYYLDPTTGYRAEGVVRVPYPTEAINGITYAPDQESIDYAASKGQTFIDAETGLFIFGDDGKFQSTETGMGTYLDATRWAANGHIAWHPGMQKVEGDYYYFLGDVTIGGNILSTGDIHVSRDNTDFGAVESGIYTFAENGKLCLYHGITDMDDGSKRYYEDAQLMIGAGLVKIGENYIYVRSNGELVVGAEYWVADVNEHTEINVGMAQFDENGFMIIELPQTAKTGVYAENGGWVYYVNGDKQYNAGLILLPEGTNWYDAEGSVVKTAAGASYVYVRSNAQLATGTYWITNTNGAMAAGKYDFDEYGLIQTQMNGIYYENGGLYFYKDNRIQYNAGLMQYSGTSSEGVVYDNDWIYVRSNGQLAIGTYWITNTNDKMDSGKYEFDENGKMLVEAGKSGIVAEGGKLYFYVDGVKQVGTGLTAYNGGYIYVKTSGELATGDYWVTNTGETGMSQGMYTFGDDGYLIG